MTDLIVAIIECDGGWTGRPIGIICSRSIRSRRENMVVSSRHNIVHVRIVMVGASFFTDWVVKVSRCSSSTGNRAQSRSLHFHVGETGTRSSGVVPRIILVIQRSTLEPGGGQCGGYSCVVLQSLCPPPSTYSEKYEEQDGCRR